MAYESVLGLFVDNEFGATPKDIAILVTSTGIISVIIQLFAVDWVVRRFGEAAVLNIFLGVAAAWFFTFHLCTKLYHVFRCYDDYFPINLYIETCFDDTYFQIGGERARICDGHEQCLYEHRKCSWTTSCRASI